MSQKPLVVCLHHAGGDASTFRPWAAASASASASAEVVPVQLPTVGDGPLRRRRYLHVDDRVPVLAEHIVGAVAGRSFILFGYSMGGVISYLLARHWCEQGDVRPAALVVECCPPPHALALELPGDGPIVELASWLRRIDGIADWLAAEPEILGTHIGLLRGDLQLCRSYRHQSPAERLPIPTHVIGARFDPLFPPARLSGWSELVLVRSMTVLDGGHFLLRDAGVSLLEHVLAQTVGLASNAPAVGSAAGQ